MDKLRAIPAPKTPANPVPEEYPSRMSGARPFK